MREKSSLRKRDHLTVERNAQKKWRKESSETEVIHKDYFFAKGINPFYTSETCDKRISNYRRSLKLLGVHIPELESKITKSYRCASAQSWGGTASILQTRLKKKSTSLEDVTRAIPDLKHPEKLHRTSLGVEQRKVLSQAVYEEWYFNKLKELKEKKHLLKEEEQQNKSYQEKLELKRKEDAEERFQEWLNSKEEKRREERRTIKAEPKKKDDKFKKEERAEKGFESWIQMKLVKDKEKRMKMKEDKQIKSQKEFEKQKQKEEAADLVFKSWLKKKNRQRDERRRREEKERMLKEEMEEYEKEERRRGAILVFNHWKKNKQKDEKLKYDDNATSQMRGNSSKKSKNPPKTYSEWLDEVDDRENDARYYHYRKNLELALKPPWIPGGGSMPSLLIESTR